MYKIDIEKEPKKILNQIFIFPAVLEKANIILITMTINIFI
jgi:hypothetical protein